MSELVQRLSYYSDTFARIPVTNMMDVGKTSAILISSILGYKKVAIFYEYQQGQIDPIAVTGDILLKSHTGRDPKIIVEHLWNETTRAHIFVTASLQKKVRNAAESMGMENLILVVPIISETERGEQKKGLVLTTTHQPNDFDRETDLTILEILTGLISGAIRNSVSHHSLKGAHKRMLTILDSIEATIHVIDVRTYEILYLNKIAKEIYGDVYGEICWEVLQKGKSGPCEFCPIEKLTDGAEKDGNVFVWEQLDPFCNRWISKQERLIKWVDGSLVKVHIGIDIHKQKQALEDKDKMQSQLHHAQKLESIGRLAGGVAHDFNNILSAINGYSELCLTQMDEQAPFRKEIKIIHDSGQRAARLTQQLLAFGRKQFIENDLLDLNKEVDTINSMLCRLIGENINVEIIYGENIWPIKFNRSHLEQVLINLVVNARDAMPEGGLLLIETSNITIDVDYTKTHVNIQPGDYIMLTVSDNGHGMDKSTRDQIFDPFFTTKETGSGLGLSTIYGVIKQNNGEIYVYSEPEQGTTFKIYFPRAEGKTAKRDEDSQKQELITNKMPRTILLVEDDKVLRDMCVVVLSKLGFSILEAENGEEALQTISKFHGTIDLLLTDVVMPKMNGVDLAEKVEILHPEVKIIFMSGYTENATIKQKILSDSVNFISKPVTPVLLSNLVKKVLG
jgi:signal transduction histidine kinase